MQAAILRKAGGSLGQAFKHSRVTELPIAIAMVGSLLSLTVFHLHTFQRAQTSSAWGAGVATWTPPSSATAGRTRRTRSCGSCMPSMVRLRGWGTVV